MAEGFRVARALAARAATSTSARGDLATTPVSVVSLAGRAAVATSARGSLSTGAEIETIGPIPGVAVRIALAYYPEDAPVARYDQAVYDAAVYAEPPPLDDISCLVQSYASRLGRDEPLDRMRVGTCAVVIDDPDGRYSPWRTAAESDEFGDIRPGIDLYVWIETEAGTWPRFTGRVVAITDEFPTPNRHQVRFDAADYMSLLAVFDGVEQPAVGGGELSGARLTRICDLAVFDKPRRFDLGTAPLQATTLAKNALDEAGIVCDSELGVLYCTPDGTLVHRDHNALVSDPRFVDVQDVFGEQDPELCYTEISLAFDTTTLRNLVSIANVGGTAVTVDDPVSRSLYGTHTYRRFDLIHQDPAQSTQIADRHLAFHAYATNRVETLTVTPHVFPAQLDRHLALQVLDRIEVRRRADGFQVVAELQIEAITEVVDPSTWTIEYTTFSADAIFDVGRYDVDLYDSGLWGY